MSGPWTGLGFDPAAGEPEDVRRCARQHARAAAELDELASQLATVGEVSASWRGAAATAFAAAVAPLPAQLRAAGEAFGATAARLSAWAAELEELQAQARALERRASAALDAMRAAHAREASARGGAGATALVGSGLSLPDVAEAEQELHRATWAADDVKARWRAGGRRVAAAVRSAAEAAPPVPASLGELVWQHRRGISAVADVCSVISLPVGFIPVAGQPLAAGLGVASTTGQAALAAYADGSLTDVALGALGVGLGGASMVAAHAVKAPATSAATRATARALDVGHTGYSAVGPAMTVHRRSVGAAAPPAPAGAATSPPTDAPLSRGAPVPGRSSPALRHLLVMPVMPTTPVTSVASVTAATPESGRRQR